MVFGSCHKRNTYQKVVNTNLSERFLYIKDSSLDTSLTAAIREEIDKGFNLEPIEFSDKKAEIRIYYLGNWNSRFLRQLFIKDSVIAELYQCRVANRGDSIFMKLGDKITAKGLAATKILDNIEELPSLFRDPIQDDALDNSNYYLIQLKYNNNIKTITINNPFTTREPKKNLHAISKFITSISQEYSFNFFSPWKEIDSLAFKSITIQLPKQR